MKTQIIEVTDKKRLKQFIDFPHELYRNDKNYVPELYIAVKELLDRKKNPFFKHSEAAYFLALKNNKVVGRIAAIHHKEYQRYHNSDTGFFGFFDVIEDQEVADSLFETVEIWLKKRKLTRLIGPANFSTNDTAAMLIEGYDSPPLVQMTYNFPYYNDLVTSYGFEKDMDMYAYFIPTDEVNNKSVILAKRIEKRLNTKGVTIRCISKKNFNSEVAKIKEIYRAAWEKNWGFVPPSDEEFQHMADSLKLVVQEKYTYVAEKNGKMVAFAFGIPNINEITIEIKKGRLFPTGIFKLLMRKNKTKRIRIALLGVLEEYRNMGIEAIFFARFIEEARKNNLIGGEASWVLENNTMMVAAAEKLNGKKYKTYRMYTKSITV